MQRTELPLPRLVVSSKCAGSRVDRMLELMMIDRQMLGDVVFAALVAIPAAALARPEGIPHGRTAVSAPARNSIVALAPAGDRQVGLFR